MANDEKPTRKPSPLHDNPRSRKDAEPEKPNAEEASEPAPNGDTVEAEAGAEAPAGSPDVAASDKFMEGLQMIQKRHESERMDHHGAMREAHRTMNKRHNKEIRDHFALHYKGEEEPEAKPKGEEE